MALFGKKEQTTPEITIGREELEVKRQGNVMEASTYDDAYYMNNQEDKENLTRWQQDLDPDLLDLKYDLLNYCRDENNKYNPIAGLDPMINEKGIYFVLATIKRYVNRNTMRCSMDEITILKKMRNFGSQMAIALATNYDTYAIDMTQYPSINDAIRNMVHSTLLRALNDGERRSEREIRRIIESMNQNKKEDDPKKSMMKW